MSTEQSTTPKTETPAPEMTAESAIEHAKRAFALRKYEQAVDYYATALELVSEKLGEDSPEIADLYFAYGKALLENAISQNSVLGKEKQEEEHEDVNKAQQAGTSKDGPVLSFSGDAEEAEEDPAVDLFAQAAEAVAEADAEANAQDDDDEDDNAEPEDDFNAAWEVLDLARTIYDKQYDTDTSNEDVALKLADTYIALGDVSLETEKFDQAINDYEAGLLLKSKLLPLSSRQIAEAHYKLSIVLDLTSGRLADAITHAEQALQSIQTRLDELQQASLSPSASKPKEEKPDPKGKGKASATILLKNESVQNLSSTQIEGEIKELEELKQDLALKIEELKLSPNETLAGSAPAMAAQALDKELGTGPISSSTPAAVNDLTSMVRKKKAPAPAADASPSKRKAEDGDDSDGLTSEKKPKLDTPEAS